MHPIDLVRKQFAEATCGTIRLKPLNIGTLLPVSVRRDPDRDSLRRSCSYREEFAPRLRPLLGRLPAVPPGPAPFRCNPKELGYRQLELKIACTSVNQVTSKFDQNAHDRLAPQN